MDQYFQKTKDAIDKYIQKGYSIGAIRKSFLEAGYKRDVVDEILKGYSEEARMSYQRHAFIIFLVIILPGIVTVLLYSVFTGPVDCGTDMECFSERAMRCEHVLGEIDIQGSVLALQARDCVLDKRIRSFDPSEPPEIQALLGNTSMRCPYPEGAFDTALLSLGGALYACEGELKDAVAALQLAQQELR